jgi:hypothetical protein
MKQTSAKRNKVVRIGAAEISDPTPGDLARLRKAMARARPTPDAPEVEKIGPRPRRDADGNLVKRPLSPIRKAILTALGRRQMTRYQLWQKAHAHHPTLSQSAVYEYLRGERDIGVTSAEALMAAAGVRVGPGKPSAPKSSNVGGSKHRVPVGS